MLSSRSRLYKLDLFTTRSSLQFFQKYFVVHEQSAVENSYIRMLCPGRFILVESVYYKISNWKSYLIASLKRKGSEECNGKLSKPKVSRQMQSPIHFNIESYWKPLLKLAFWSILLRLYFFVHFQKDSAKKYTLIHAML